MFAASLRAKHSFFPSSRKTLTPRIQQQHNNKKKRNPFRSIELLFPCCMVLALLILGVVNLAATFPTFDHRQNKIVEQSVLELGLQQYLQVYHTSQSRTQMLEYWEQGKTDKNPFEQPPDDLIPPYHLVWLASFPNSGTSYTHMAAAIESGVACATNYGPESVETGLGAGLSGELEPINHVRAGPFWIPWEGDIHRPPPSPSQLILTKTHCGGFDLACQEGSCYNLFLHEFVDKCRETAVLFPPEQEKEIVRRYPMHWVKKVVHMVRDPFNNIVSRFHLERHLGRANYTTPCGFREFCQRVDERRPPAITDQVWEHLQKVPCYSDFAKWIFWHNNLNSLANMYQLPQLVIQYERYQHHSREIMKSIVEFMEQPSNGTDHHPSFQDGKSYRHMYKPHEMHALREAFRVMASQTTWSQIQHYFEPSSLLGSPGPTVC